MAYDEDLANRIRELLADQDGVTEKRMFGGLAFLVHDNMAVAASRKGGVLVRIDPDESDDLVAAPGVERMVIGWPGDGELAVRGPRPGPNEARPGAVGGARRGLRRTLP